MSLKAQILMMLVGACVGSLVVGALSLAGYDLSPGETAILIGLFVLRNPQSAEPSPKCGRIDPPCRNLP